MSLTQWGLLLNFVGSALVGLAAYFGIVSGFGALVWKPRWLEVVFWVGWILLTFGFLLQLWASRKAHGT